MRKIDYLELGGTLYIPAIHKNLEPILKGEKFPFLTSAVICLEDSIKEEELKTGVERVTEVLNDYTPSRLKLFIRPRNIENLKTLLNLKDISKIDGFVLPKIDLNNLDSYCSIIPKEFYIMPTIESILSDNILKKIYNRLLNYNILSIRVGIEDILGSFGIVRKCGKSYFENMIMSNYLYKIITTFKPKFQISAPVYPCFEDSEMLKKEVELEKELQIFNKTIIHPNQAKILNQLYKVEDKKFQIATKMIDDKKAIFEVDKRMYEYATHHKWAQNILKRGNFYGTK